MNKATWIKAWFTVATVYTCIDLSKIIADEFLCGSQWFKLFGAVLLIFAISWGARSKLKELN
ncbi:hypothetical protein [Serratia nematodiphila]|jgi:hypothetical protein|uniref:hypothetical protein n=1 Tax=Serratia nematodiphila TaxID=458197 RepID=UPI0011D5BC27|nr:hypothetical protein [Serratia nematodiphila]TXE64567.1 hypothetical protein FOT58_09490 [Serratia nematodiphila]